jgi:hypothetical protein
MRFQAHDSRLRGNDAVSDLLQPMEAVMPAKERHPGGSKPGRASSQFSPNSRDSETDSPPQIAVVWIFDFSESVYDVIATEQAGNLEGAHFVEEFGSAQQ